MHFQCWKSTRRREKIFILWILLLIQLLLIGVFVLFGTSNSLTDDILDDSLQAYRPKDLSNSKTQKIVKFLTNDISIRRAATISSSSSISPLILQSPKFFHQAYFECRSGKPANFTLDTLFCFRNSSVLPASAILGRIRSSEEDEECICKCQEGYHARDCSQPESVWRAFITTRLSNRPNNINNDLLNDRNGDGDTEPKPRRIFYLINASALSLTTIEIQFMELHDLIDLLVLCDEIRNDTSATHGVTSKYERFRYHQMSNEHTSSFFLKRMKAKILILETRHKCTSRWMYKAFRRHLNTVQPDESWNGNDVLLYSSYDEILNRRTIEYMKWNNQWLQLQPIRFRLKYTVYGFYWQHPIQTILGSVAYQLYVLEELYKGDPEAVLNSTATGMIIGDLNHYGGWFCQYCYESTTNIAQKVQRDRMMNATSSMNVEQSNYIKENINDLIHQAQQPQRYDSAYIESLISAGVYVDGKLNLLRLHRYSDKYFAPNWTNDKGWKYESLLTNTYAHYDGDVDE